MNFTNINDPAGVKALLDQLRSSQALQQTIIPAAPVLQDELVQAEATNNQLDDSQTSATVASLLSQLQSASNLPSETQINYPHTTAGPGYVEPSSAPRRSADLRSCTFQQALPLISQLARDSRVVGTIGKMKQEQAQLESRLWADREAIQRKHEERVQLAQKKAQVIGAALTQFEADSMSDSFRRELQKFDAERVLPAWDGLVARQQAALESVGIPCLYPTVAPAEIQKQQRVLQVLEGFIDMSWDEQAARDMFGRRLLPSTLIDRDGRVRLQRYLP